MNAQTPAQCDQPDEKTTAEPPRREARGAHSIPGAASCCLRWRAGCRRSCSCCCCSRPRHPRLGPPAHRRRAAWRSGSASRSPSTARPSSRCARSRTCSRRCAAATTPCAAAMPARATRSATSCSRSNRLGATLRSQRFEALEASALLHKVLAEIDVAVLAFDGDGRHPAREPRGRRAAAAPRRIRWSGFRRPKSASQSCSRGRRSRASPTPSRRAAGRWQVMREIFREGGRPFRLLVVTDLSQALRDEERRAWRRLIRVIWHELNNSLAPIKSVIETSRDALAAGRPTSRARGARAQPRAGRRARGVAAALPVALQRTRAACRSRRIADCRCRRPAPAGRRRAAARACAVHRAGRPDRCAATPTSCSRR